MDSIPYAAGEGSSPLTRGKHTRRQVPRNDHGLIPAHAGKTKSGPVKSKCEKAHPRSRGENDALPGCTTGWEGSSPLTRGKRRNRRANTSREGLIPAHAGKTNL